MRLNIQKIKLLSQFLYFFLKTIAKLCEYPLHFLIDSMFQVSSCRGKKLRKFLSKPKKENNNIDALYIDSDQFYSIFFSSFFYAFISIHKHQYFFFFLLQSIKSFFISAIYSLLNSMPIVYFQLNHDMNDRIVNDILFKQFYRLYNIKKHFFNEQLNTDLHYTLSSNVIISQLSVFKSLVVLPEY